MRNVLISTSAHPSQNVAHSSSAAAAFPIRQTIGSAIGRHYQNRRASTTLVVSTYVLRSTV
jgi:hypothetical protein